jgi:hypothetical protein
LQTLQFARYSLPRMTLIGVKRPRICAFLARFVGRS